jgi:hypothetical protein
MNSEQSEIDAMLNAGMPLWAAFALWVEMLYAADGPTRSLVGNRLKGEPRPTERLR